MTKKENIYYINVVTFHKPKAPELPQGEKKSIVKISI